MENSTQDSEKATYLHEKCDAFMTDLILQILSVRPSNVVQFIHDYTGKLMRNEPLSNKEITQELRNSIPNFSWPNDQRTSTNGSPEQDIRVHEFNSPTKYDT